MKEKILAICDEDREYINRLGRYITGRAEPSVRVACFSDREKFREYARGHTVDLFLAGADWVNEEICGDARRWVLLSEGDEGENSGSGEAPHPSISRYQAADVILTRVLQLMELPGRQKGSVAGEASLIGVYAPAGWSESALLALALTARLGREGPAVYVGLSEFSPVMRMTDRAKGQDLSDIAYCFRRGSLTYDRLERMTVHLEGFDCIPAPANPAELAELMGAELSGLLESICSVGGYQYIVADFGGSISGRLALFESCRMNAVLFSDSEAGRMQREEFEGFWRSVGAQELLDRSELVVLSQEEQKSGWKGRTEGYVNELAERILRSKGIVDTK